MTMLPALLTLALTLALTLTLALALSEARHAQHVMRQVLEVLAFMHAHGEP